ncbi:hypothetical protein BKA61DRAFT_625908 [Leptodontidium sp. MPI-SDFR-AT-0119]|nr:hypothetical protein BKA61DRAFT_625908 [Leptodontidium sp. MPI-SDFR-AT-0119]
MATEGKQMKLDLSFDARPSSQIEPEALFLSGPGEPGAALRMNEEPRSSLSLNLATTLSEMRSPKTSRMPVMKNIAIWVDQDDSRSPAKTGEKERCSRSLDGEGDCGDDISDIRSRICCTRPQMGRPDNDTFHIHGKPLPIRRIKSAIRDMIRDAEDILWKDLMLVSRKEDRFNINLETIQDDLLFARLGALENKSWMVDQMLKDIGDGKLYDKKTKSWRMPQVRQYRQHQTRFLELLLILFYITTVPIGCGEGIASLRFRGPKRSICLINGRLAFTTRSKTASGESKDTLQFLPWSVGRLLALYLAYIQRFSAFLAPGADRPLPSSYLWHHENRPWTLENLTTILAHETGIRTGLRLSIQDYRDVAISMGYEYIGAEFMKDLVYSDEQLGGCGEGNIADFETAANSQSVDLYEAIASQWHLVLGLSSKKP